MQMSARNSRGLNQKLGGFSDEERAWELKAAARANKDKAGGESDVLARIAELQEPERAMAMRLHEIVKASAPGLARKTVPQPW
jgi:hypothetical protein